MRIKKISSREKIQRNFTVASILAVTVILMINADFGAVILLWLGLVVGTIIGLNYIEKNSGLKNEKTK